MASVFEDDTLPSRRGLSLPWLHLTLFKLQFTDHPYVKSGRLWVPMSTSFPGNLTFSTHS